MNLLLALPSVFFLAASLHAANPIITDVFTADPAALGYRGPTTGRRSLALEHRALHGGSPGPRLLTTTTFD